MAFGKMAIEKKWKNETLVQEYVDIARHMWFQDCFYHLSERSQSYILAKIYIKNVL